MPAALGCCPCKQIWNITDHTVSIHIPVKLARACFPHPPCEVQLAFTVDGTPAAGELLKQVAIANGGSTMPSYPAMLLQDWLWHTRLES